MPKAGPGRPKSREKNAHLRSYGLFAEAEADSDVIKLKLLNDTFTQSESD